MPSALKVGSTWHVHLIKMNPDSQMPVCVRCDSNAKLLPQFIEKLIVAAIVIGSRQNVVLMMEA